MVQLVQERIWGNASFRNYSGDFSDNISSWQQHDALSKQQKSNEKNWILLSICFMISVSSVYHNGWQIGNPGRSSCLSTLNTIIDDEC